MSKDGDDHCIKNQSADDDNHTKMNRRSMLLGGTTLAAISTVAPGSPVQHCAGAATGGAVRQEAEYPRHHG